ncbi:MAG: cell division protein SepF [Clostridia bacterium]|nr:cell division protein SepF [Clostridia bacterium]
MAFWDGILNWLGYGPEDELPELSERERWAEARPRGNSKAKLVSLPTTRNSTRLVISRPQSFDEAASLAENLKNFRPLIVNLEDLPIEEARRIIDFLSGATFALGGQVRRITGGIFIFASSNIDLSGATEKSINTDIDWLKVAGRS